MPEALLGGPEALDGPDHGQPMWLANMETVSFCELGLLLQLQQRPYHRVTLSGLFNVKRLVRDYRDSLYRSERTFNGKARARLERLLLCLGEGVFVYLESEVSLAVYGPTPQSAAKVALRFRRYLRGNRNEPKKPAFYLVGLGAEGPYAQQIAVESSAPASEEEVALHYGNDFLDWERHWVERLKQRRSGISILFGPPGCGKTCYLRSLMRRLLGDFVFYYLPISCFDVLASPSFVQFWIEQTRMNLGKRQIAILEDAEELLTPRDETSRAKVSNLLNIGDGFLGEHLKLHVIATTNVPLQRLDAALLRPGRLIGVRQFRRLARQEALRLCRAKGLELPEQEQDFSLAEIYNQSQNTGGLCSPAIGFVQRLD